MTQQLANRPQNQLARPQQGPPLMQGEEADDTLLPRLHLYQGLGEEEAKFGEHAKGDLINTLDGTVVATKEKPLRFIPLFAWAEYIRFAEPRGTGVVYHTRDKAEVPAEDLEWRGEGKDRKGPAATRFINWAVMAEGIDMPVVLSFKTTSINTGKTLLTLEKMRQARGKGPGFYQHGTTAKKNAKGMWLTPVIKPLAEKPPEDLVLIATEFRDGMNPNNVRTNIDETADDEPAPASEKFDPDCPI